MLDFIETHRKTTNVFVHCFAGVSRSATTVIAYLMKTNGWSMKKAKDYVFSKRSIIFPNSGFIR